MHIMNPLRIHSQADYKTALKKVSSLIDADPDRGSAEGHELETLGALVEAYEAQHYNFEHPINGTEL